MRVWEYARRMGVDSATVLDAIEKLTGENEKLAATSNIPEDPELRRDLDAVISALGESEEIPVPETEPEPAPEVPTSPIIDPKTGSNADQVKVVTQARLEDIPGFTPEEPEEELEEPDFVPGAPGLDPRPRGSVQLIAHHIDRGKTKHNVPGRVAEEIAAWMESQGEDRIIGVHATRTGFRVVLANAAKREFQA